MRTSVEELARRWSRLRGVLDDRGLDAAVVRGPGQSPEMMYLTGTWLQAPDAFFLLARDGDSELVVRGGYGRVGAGDTLGGDWLKVVREQPSTTAVPARVTEWLAAHGARRVGVNVTHGAAATWVAALGQQGAELETHPIQQDVLALRYVKGKEELEILRTSAQLADEVWRNAADFVQEGRSPRQIIGDIQHYLVSNGCDVPIASYYGSLVVILMPNPPLDWFTMSEPLQRGDYFSLEVSPRIEGYHSQLTGVISIGPAAPKVQRSHDSIVRARRASLQHVRAGEDAATAARAMLDVLEADGYGSRDGNIGHLLGLDITEPRVGSESFALQAGMTLVAHPMLRSEDVQMLLSGETYLVTEGDPERLNAISFDDIVQL